MLSFTEYAKYYHKPTVPVVHFDIKEREQQLDEGVPIAGNYEDYIGPEDGHPLKNGYVREYGPIYSHPAHPGKFFHFAGTSTPKQFGSYESALEDNMQIKHDRETNVVNRAAELEQHYDKSKFNDAHKGSIWGYTMFDSKTNLRLLQQANGGELSENENKLVNNLDTALSVVKTHRPLELYSGTSASHAALLRNNDVVDHPGYISTSINAKKALNFAKNKGGDVIKIHLPQGHHGAYVGEMSAVPGEREFIVPRGMRLKIDHSKREIIVDDMHHWPIYLHHAYPVEK